MKRFSKTISILLSMLMLLSAATVFADAATAVPTAKVICCNDGSCGDWQQLIRQCSSGKCDLQSLLNQCGNSGLSEWLKKAGVSLPDGCGSTPMLPAVPTEPPAAPTEPTDAPAAPAAPTEPTAPTAPVTPTEPAAPTEKPEPTAPAATQPAATPSSAFNTAYENEVVSLVNAERAKAGLSALSVNSGARDAAHIRAKEIVQSFSHTRPDGRSCFTAASDIGVSYRTAGENIAYGYATPQQVVTGWMNSERHRRNILSSSFSKIGVGCYAQNGVLYWSQFFIG